MNPAEEIPPEHAHRAYYRQPVWKRIVVIAAGPAVNIVLAFVILAGVFLSQGTVEPPLVVGTIEQNTPAATTLKKGDVLLAVDGKPLTGNYTAQLEQVQKQVGTHKGTPVAMTVAPRRPRAGRDRQDVLRRQEQALPLRLRLRPGGERPAPRARCARAAWPSRRCGR